MSDWLQKFVENQVLESKLKILIKDIFKLSFTELTKQLKLEVRVRKC